VEELMAPGWQYEQSYCSVCKALFNHAIYGIYEGFYQVVLDFLREAQFATADVLSSSKHSASVSRTHGR
jgi:hypothetical protein